MCSGSQITLRFCQILNPEASSTGPLSVGKVSTGCGRLDEALRGGFPIGSAVAISSPTSSKAFGVIRDFLRAREGEKALFICRSLPPIDAQMSGNLSFLVCGERVVASENVFAGKGLENLTELSIDIASTVARVQPKRVALDILSDLLLRHGSLQTRKWVSEQLSKLTAKGITTLAAFNPAMHIQADSTAILDLFDGSLELAEADAVNEPVQVIRVKWMRGIELQTREVPLGPWTVPIRKPSLPTPNNLPTPPTPLIGREKELDAAMALLSEGQSRILTITGPGGAGKTRLALELAIKLRDRFENGAFFISLDSIQDSALVIPTIATFLGLKEKAETTLLEMVKTYLSVKQMLLVLDNLEQVIAAAPSISDLLMGSPRVTFIVTSRAPLRIRGEREFSVPPLSFPDPKHLPTLESLSQYGAVQLFIQRAVAVKPDFTVTNSNALAVVEICRRLDGLPLAIELAAARIRLLQPSSILGHLKRRLKFLTSGARDLPARQQTLRDTIAWSHELLTDAEKRLFRRLSVFDGGCSMDGAEQVCNTPREINLDIINNVESLAAQNLLRIIEADGETRILMLETIREYAIERLNEAGEMEELQHLHADFYLKLANEAEAGFFGPQEPAQLDRLERDHGNLLAAFRSMLAQDRGEEALRLGAILSRFWELRGPVAEGFSLLEAALALPSASSRTRARALALFGKEDLMWFLGKPPTERASLAQEGLSIAREIGDNGLIAEGLARTSDYVGIDHAKGRSLSEESLAMARMNESRKVSMYALRNLGWYALTDKDYVKARSFFEEALALVRGCGYKHGLMLVTGDLGGLTYRMGDYAASRAFLTEHLDLARELKDQRSVAKSLADLGRIACRRGDAAEAYSFSKESIEAAKELGYEDKGILSEANDTLALVAVRGGEYDRAEALFLEVLATKVSLDQSKGGIVDSLAWLAEVSLGRRDAERAARLLGAAESLSRAIEYKWHAGRLAEYAADSKAAQDVLGRERFERLRAEGASMTFEQAVAYAENRPTTNTQETSKNKDFA